MNFCSTLRTDPVARNRRMSTTFAPDETATAEKPELVLRSPQFKALGTFLVMGIIAGVYGLYEVFCYVTDGSNYFDELTIFLILLSSVGSLSIVVGNVITRRTLV